MHMKRFRKGREVNMRLSILEPKLGDPSSCFFVLLDILSVLSLILSHSDDNICYQYNIGHDCRRSPGKGSVTLADKSVTEKAEVKRGVSHLCRGCSMSNSRLPAALLPWPL